MKRIVSIILALTLISCMIPTAMAANEGLGNFQKVNSYTSGQFSDVETSAWYSENIQTAFELGLVKGSSTTAFNPNGNITIAETIALACRLHSIYNANKAEFVQESPWYQVYVDYAIENGLITKGQFASYTNNATRAQFAIILANALPDSALSAINTISKGDLPDVAANVTYADEVYRLYNAGILTGSDKYGTFKPDSNIQRSEVATIVTRMAVTALRQSVKLATTLDMLQGVWHFKSDLVTTELIINGNEITRAQIWNDGDMSYWKGTFVISDNNIIENGNTYLFSSSGEILRFAANSSRAILSLTDTEVTIGVVTGKYTKGIEDGTTKTVISKFDLKRIDEIDKEQDQKDAISAKINECRQAVLDAGDLLSKAMSAAKSSDNVTGASYVIQAYPYFTKAMIAADLAVIQCGTDTKYANVKRYMQLTSDFLQDIDSDVPMNTVTESNYVIKANSILTDLNLAANMLSSAVSAYNSIQ